MQKIDWHLLKKSVLGKTSPEEELNVRVWKEDSKENRKYYERLDVFLNRTEKESVDVEKNYRHFIRTTEKRMLWKIIRYSGIAACFMGIGMILLMVNKPAGVIIEPQAIVAGTSKAILYIGNDKPILLERETRKTISTANYLELRQEDNQINYTVTDSGHQQPAALHTLQIPRGGEFQLCLSDGTLVYINSESELKYPAIFTGDQRKVSLVGEAYFRVTKSSKPFIIELNGMEVEVLGTEFNVRAYPDERTFQTTLVNGKVKVKSENEKMLLQPGEQAVYMGKGKGLTKHKVDVSKYTAWKDGNVAFENERLEDIMNKLAKWYNIEVFYTSPGLKNIRFTGNINRYGDIRVLLTKIEKLDVVCFDIKENCITIKANSKEESVSGTPF